MGGFGGGPAGGNPFGGFYWSLAVLFGLAPEVYRIEDLEQGDYFQRYARAQGYPFMALRQKIANFADLRDPRAVRTQYDEVTTLRLGPIQQIKGPIEQSGLRGSVSALQEFIADRARFTFADVGKELTVSRSSIPGNNRAVVITNIVDSRTVLTNPTLTVDAGPLRWEIRQLEASTVKQLIVSVRSGDVSLVGPGWILTDGTTEFTVTKRQQFKSAQDERKLLTLREGADGSINASLYFTSATVTLTSRDVGRRISLSSAANYQNIGVFGIVDVLNATTAILDASGLVVETTGEIVWALLRDPELTLAGQATLRGVIEQEGEDGAITVGGPPAVFQALSASFSADSVGKLLTLHKPGSGNNGTYSILAFVSLSTVQIDGTLIPETDLHWDVRVSTTIGDETQVEVRASSLIPYLAQDFGVDIDFREDEEYQRRWVESVTRWIGMKGTENSYKFLAELTGFLARVAGLYRVSQEVYLAGLAAGAVSYEIGDPDVSRFGTNGSLDLVGGRVRFSALTAVFVEGDVGRQIDVSGSGAGNDGFRTIALFINSTTVEFRASDTMVGVADPNNGALSWMIVRLYSEQAPTIPVYDEINADRMVELKGATVFVVDKYCWEQTPASWSTLLGAGDGLIEITATTPVLPSSFPITYTVTGRGDFDVVTGLSQGKWVLTSGGAPYYLETVPALGAAEQSGADGSLTLAAPARFSSPTAVFSASSVGKRLVVTGSGSGNDRTYIVAAFVGVNDVDLDLSHVPTTPDANNGALTWELCSWEFSVVATIPPTVGAATLEYVCSEQMSCDFCKSNKVLVEATTPYLLERGFERLSERLDQITPKHVERFENFGVSPTARLLLTATLDSP